MKNIPDCCYEYRFNREEPKAVAVCSICGFDIYAGEKYLPSEDRIICRDCLEDLMEVAEEGF